MEICRISEYSWLILIGPSKFEVLAGFSEKSDFEIFLPFDSDDAENARAANFDEIWECGKNISFNCPKSLPCGWRLSAVPTGCVGGASWLFTRCSQRILVASPRLKPAIAPLPAADFVIACDAPGSSLSLILRTLLANRGSITIFEGSCSAAEAAAAAVQAPVVVVGKIGRKLITQKSEFYEFQPKSVQLEILEMRPVNMNLFFVDLISDLSPAVEPSAVFVPRGSSAASQAWLHAHSKLKVSLIRCEPEIIGIEELRKFTSSEIISESRVIPPSQTRILTGPLSARTSIKCNPDGFPQLVPS